MFVHVRLRCSVGLKLVDEAVQPGRTARALLDWTQPDLAKAARIALATLKRFEKGYRTSIPVVRAAIFAALEKACVQFQDDGKRIS